MEIKNKNILVTGGTGFVGGHLVEEVAKNNTVIVLYRSQNPRSYFFSKGLNKKTILLQGDIRNFDLIFDIVLKYKTDYIFHLAAQAVVDTAYLRPRSTLETNILGTVNVLEAARKFNFVKGIIFASSDKAYGKMPANSRGKKYKEFYSLQGDHPYEVSKSAADLICQTYYKTYNVPVIITRFGNIFGEGDLNFSRIIPGIMQYIVLKKKLELRSDGTYVRDYVYVKDVVKGYIKLAEQIKATKGQAFNFGSKNTYSVKQLISEIQKILKIKIIYIIKNTAKNEIPYQSLDYSKIQQTIDWSPKKTLKTTMLSLLDWYKNYFYK